MDIKETMNLIIMEMKRVEKLISYVQINNDGTVDCYWNPIVSELKCKMHELRRDLKTLERQIYKPYEYIGDNKNYV